MAVAAPSAATGVILGDPNPPTPLRRRLGLVALVITVIVVLVLLAEPGLIAHQSPIATGDDILKPP